jgi:hypothetical protein
MAPQHKHRLSHHKSANKKSVARHGGHLTAAKRDVDRAKEILRTRDRQEHRIETILGRKTSKHPGSLADRITYGSDNEVQDSADCSDSDDPTPHSHHGRSLESRVTRDEDFSNNGGSVTSLDNSEQDQTVSAQYDEADMDIDNFYDLFNDPTLSPTASAPRTCIQPLNTKPVQYGSSYHLPFNRYIHPPHPVQPATRPEPIRLLNSFAPPEQQQTTPEGSQANPATAVTDELVAPSTAAHKNKAPEVPKRPVNTYRGNDPLKRLVQNKKLRALLADKKMPGPRKKPDRMILKCAGRREFR